MNALTTGIDAGAAFTGGSGNDTFIGDAATASAADTIVGGGGTDTLRLFGTATAEPNHSGIEIVELNGNTNGFDVSDNADVQQLMLIDPATGQSYTIANGQKVSASTMADGEVLDILGNTVTALDLTVGGLGTQAGAGVDVDINSTAQTTLNLMTAGKASHVELVNTGGKLVTVSVAGDQKITVDAASNAIALTTLDGSKATGDVTSTFGAASDVTVTGGTGNDTANFGGTITQADKFDGGEGTDTLELTQAGVTVVQGLSATNKATLNANLANLEVLKVTDGLTSDIDASRFDNINQFVLNGGLGGAGVTTTLSNVTSGVSVSIGDAATNVANILAVAVKDATLAGNNSDAVTINLTDAAAGGASDAGVVDLVGVDLLTINTTQAAGGTTTSHTLDIKASSTALDKVTVTGNTALDISTVPLVNSVAEVDASGMTLAAATSAGLTAAIATGGTNGVKITGSGGVDNLTGGDAADIIIGGAGADNITGGAGNDVLTGGDGADTFIFAATAATNGADTIGDFKAGAGNDVLKIGAFLNGGVTAGAANLALTASSANVALTDDNVYVMNLASNVTGKDYGGADFAELFGAGNGQFNTAFAATNEAFVVVKGADVSQAYYVEDLDGNGAIDATDVTLVGTLTVDGAFASGNFIA